MFSSTLKSALVQQHLVSLGHDRLCWRVSDRRFTCFGKATQCLTNNSKNKQSNFGFMVKTVHKMLKKNKKQKSPRWTESSNPHKLTLI